MNLSVIENTILATGNHNFKIVLNFDFQYVVDIYGTDLDDFTRCAHYKHDFDIIAIKMKCCRKYYACSLCHNENEKHDVEVWTTNEMDTKAIYCGSCKDELTIETYLKAEFVCPSCNEQFNPKCELHYDHYFELL